MAAELAELPREEAEAVLASLEEEMRAASDATDFERAAALRDQVVELRAALEGTSEDAVIARLRSGARKGSSHASRKRLGGRRNPRR